jgi:hypothetical protein
MGGKPSKGKVVTFNTDGTEVKTRTYHGTKYRTIIGQDGIESEIVDDRGQSSIRPHLSKDWRRWSTRNISRLSNRRSRSINHFPYSRPEDPTTGDGIAAMRERQASISRNMNYADTRTSRRSGNSRNSSSGDEAWKNFKRSNNVIKNYMKQVEENKKREELNNKRKMWKEIREKNEEKRLYKEEREKSESDRKKRVKQYEIDHAYSIEKKNVRVVRGRV